MSRLEELIQQYCPDGVEYKEVQEVAKTTSPKGKLKSNDYLKEGKYPDVKYGIKLGYKNIGFNGKFYTFPYFLTFLLKRFVAERRTF